jgi:glycosyltransferase involved in cell wall biosynthesis
MRVTFVLPYAGLQGGIRVAAMHASGLLRRGHKVFVVSTPRPQPSLRQRLKSLLKGKGFPTLHPQMPSHFDNLPVDHKVIDRCRPVVDRDVPDADVVIATWWQTAQWVHQLSPAKGAKAYFIQGYEVDSAFDALALKATWKLPMHKIVVSRWLKDLAHSEFGDSDVSLVPNSVDLRLFHAPIRGKQPTPTVGLLYSPLRFRGVDVMLEAYRLARQTVTDLQLVAFGLEKPTPEFAFPPDAQFFHQPAQHDIPAIYSSCDAWLFGSRREGFGLPILEAMACRTPVIATPAGAAPEILTRGGGILVRSEDPQDMADHIRLIYAMTDPQWRQLSSSACQAVSTYTWDDASALFELALQRTIQRFVT